jgi:hypothetical protein
MKTKTHSTEQIVEEGSVSGFQISRYCLKKMNIHLYRQIIIFFL